MQQETNLANRNYSSLTKNQSPTIHTHQNSCGPTSYIRNSRNKNRKQEKTRPFNGLTANGSVAETLPEGPFAGETPGSAKLPGTELLGVGTAPPGCAGIDAGAGARNGS